MDRFTYLRHALAAILALVGAKMMAHDVYHANVWLTLGLIVVILASGIGYSLIVTRNQLELGEGE